MYTAVIVNVVPGAKKVPYGQVILAIPVIPSKSNVSTIPKTNGPVGVLFALNCIDPTVGVDKSDASVVEKKETTVHCVNVVIPPTIDTLVVVAIEST